MKKILVITPFFYPHIGGSEQYMEGLYAFVKKEHPELKIDVLSYNTNDSLAFEKYRGLNVYRIPCITILKDQFLLPNPKALVDFLDTHRDYDLIHTSTRFFDSSWWAPVFAKLIKSKVVLTDHCAYHPKSSNALVNLVVRLVEATIVRFSLGFYDKVYVQNKKTGAFLKENFDIKSKVAYPGLTVTKIKRQENKKLNVIYAGRMIKSKGVMEFFDIARKEKRVNFIFAGPGKLSEVLNRKVSKEKLGHIKIMGGVSKKEVEKLLLKSDIFAYPSWHSEGIPMAVLEAGEAGIPVLATDTGAIGEVIVNGKTGILVPPKDRNAFKNALDIIINDKNLRNSLSKNFSIYLKNNFSWDNASSLLLKELQ